MVSYIPTDENVSDVFTKALAKPKFQRFVEMLGLRDEGQPEGERRKERTGGKGV